jgi:hypothetical protein
MVFYFHGDDFDPGGRGDRSREILEGRGLGYAVVDQPAFLTGHWASSSGAFSRRFGSCVREFADDRNLSGELVCSPRWGTMPSAELKLPPELTEVRPQSEAAASPVASTGSGTAPDRGKVPRGFREVWYGFYPNGREVLLGVETVHGDDLAAVYAVGPSVDDAYPAAWSRRRGHIVDGSFVFDEKGKSTLRFRPRQDGGLAATWIAADGKTSLSAHLKLIDPHALAAARPAESDGVTESAPVTPAAAHRNGDQTKN